MSPVVHHLNCATLCPPAGRLINEAGHLVCHCLLIESDHGLTLIETGLGRADVDRPARLGRQFQITSRPRLTHSATAHAQIEALGLSPSDVTDIIVTHLDLDHAGGLGDFPTARVHVHETELAAATAPTRRDRSRYVADQWSHNPRWIPHGTGGDHWFGFNSVRPINDRDDLVLVPLHGHSRGHAGIAVRATDKWLVHCGDAYFHHRQLDPDDPWCPIGLRVFQRLVDADHRARRDNLERLRELASTHQDTVALLCAHDPTEFHRFEAAEIG